MKFMRILESVAEPLSDGEDPAAERYEYEPQEWCECGLRDCWVPGTLQMTAPDSLIQLPPKKVWRCKSCDAVRLEYRRRVDEPRESDQVWKREAESMEARESIVH